MTTWHRNEYLLKGLFLGLWTFVALQVSDNTARIDIFWNLGWMGVGLIVGLLLGIVRLIRMGVRPQQNWGAFPLLVLLESPTLIYCGILLGLTAGVLSGREFAEPYMGQIAGLFGLTFEDIRHAQSTNLPDDHAWKGKLPGDWLGYCAIGGLLFGFAMYRMRQVEDQRKQLFIGLFAVTALIYLAPNYVNRVPGFKYPFEAKMQESLLRAIKVPEARAALEMLCVQAQHQGGADPDVARRTSEAIKKANENEAARRALQSARESIDEDIRGKIEALEKAHVPTESSPKFDTAAATRQLQTETFGQVNTLMRAYDSRVNLGLFLLIGLPFLYVLIFVADAEEWYPDAMELSALLGASLYLIDLKGSLDTLGVYLAYLLPMALYYVYSTKVMPGLRVFKHVLRGFSYLHLERLREAIYFFRRALAVDPDSPMARQGMVKLHNLITVEKVERDPDLIAVLDFGLCLDRAEMLLNGRPSANQRAEADRFLDLVEQKGRGYQARVDYLSAVSRTHARDYDGAAELLKRLLNPETPYHGGVRKKVLYHAWHLALIPSKELEKRVGWAELNLPGRRIEAIGAVERHLIENPQDADALGLKRTLYSQLSESEFIAAAATALPSDFNYDYVEQLGMALVDDPDPDRRDRGMGFLRIAARGMPDRAPGVFRKLSAVAERMGDREGALRYVEQVKTSGQAVGPRNLSSEQRDIYFWALRKLSVEAESRGDALKAEADAARDRGDEATAAAKDEEARPYYEAAIDELRLYLDAGGRNELETYRKLAELYGKGRAIPNAVFNAVLMVETGLAYSPSDPDLLRKKDTFYYSIDPERLTALRDKVKSYFDTSYCITKAMSVLNAKDDDPGLLEWATHLATLARIMQPTGNGVRLVEARCMLRRGQREEGIRVMEAIRAGGKGSGDDLDAWYAATKILGQLYLDELNKPQEALRAFLDYKEYSKSGADTLYYVAKSYEALNDKANAARFYEAVTAYESHPRLWDAKDALRRLKGE